MVTQKDISVSYWTKEYILQIINHHYEITQKEYHRVYKYDLLNLINKYKNKRPSLEINQLNKYIDDTGIGITYKKDWRLQGTGRDGDRGVYLGLREKPVKAETKADAQAESKVDAQADAQAETPKPESEAEKKEEARAEVDAQADVQAETKNLLSPATIKTYQNCIKNLKEKSIVDFNNFEEVSKFLEENYPNDNTRKIYYNSIIYYIKNKANEKVIKQYSEKIKELVNKIELQTNKNTKTEKEEDNWLDWEDVLKFAEDFIKAKTVSPLERLVIALYT